MVRLKEPPSVSSSTGFLVCVVWFCLFLVLLCCFFVFCEVRFADLYSVCVVFFFYLYLLCVLCPVLPVFLDVLFVVATTVFSSIYLHIKHRETIVVYSIALEYFFFIFLLSVITAEHVCG